MNVLVNVLYDGVSPVCQNVGHHFRSLSDLLTFLSRPAWGIKCERRQ